jgi:uncharacterized protein YcfJ
MNKQMLMGAVAGVGIATAGGVLGFQYLGKQNADVTVEKVEEAQVAVATPTQPAARPASASQPAAAPAPRPAARPAATPQPAPTEECWDEEVTVTADPKDQHRIAGTAIGAVVGGAIGKDVGDRDLTTAAGAAAGAFIGRKIQEEVQENNAEKRTTTTIERRCGPPGSAPR